jgi:protein MpaA
VRALQHQTHADFLHATMQRYRRLLRTGARSASVPAASTHVDRRILIGRSVRGRPIMALEHGNPSAPRKVLVVGVIHGNETAGERVLRRLAREPGPSTADLWMVDRLNPDGVAAGTRQNAHGVDLNRNFPYAWRPLGRRGDLTWSGPGPLSEPESRAARTLIRRLHPAVTIWFHQPLGIVDRSGGNVHIERTFASRTGLPLRRLVSYPGSATRWQNHRFRGTTAFVVELPPGPLAGGLRDRCVRAILALTH